MTRHTAIRRQRQYTLRVEPEMTLTEVGEALDITPKCARQAESCALRKLKAAFGAKGLRFEDFF